MYIDTTLQRSDKHGNRTFPNRSDYEEYFVKKGFVDHPEDIWKVPELVWSIQRHWHISGHNGCVFSQLIGLRDLEYGWNHKIFNESSKELHSKDFLREVDQTIKYSLDIPDHQLLSLLFPQIIELEDLVSLVNLLRDNVCIFLDYEKTDGSYTAVGLRTPIDSRKVLSWIIGFSPIQCMPNTRRAPSTELVIRVKPKPKKLFFRLNQDPKAAHLADVQLPLNDRNYDKLYDQTVMLTERILFGERRHYANAKVTFKLPTELWRASTP